MSYLSFTAGWRYELDQKVAGKTLGSKCGVAPEWLGSETRYVTVTQIVIRVKMSKFYSVEA